MRTNAPARRFGPQVVSTIAGPSSPSAARAASPISVGEAKARPVGYSATGLRDAPACALLGVRGFLDVCVVGVGEVLEASHSRDKCRCGLGGDVYPSGGPFFERPVPSRVAVWRRSGSRNSDICETRCLPITGSSSSNFCSSVAVVELVVSNPATYQTRMTEAVVGQEESLESSRRLETSDPT